MTESIGSKPEQEEDATSDSSSNDKLARRIVNALVEQGLLTPHRASKALDKIRQGSASQSDWRLWAEDFCVAQPQEDGSDVNRED